MPETERHRRLEAILVLSVVLERDDPPDWAIEYVQQRLTHAENRGFRKGMLEAAAILSPESSGRLGRVMFWTFGGHRRLDVAHEIRRKARGKR